MSKQEIAEIQGKLFTLERKIRPLEWDNSRNQINEYRKKHLQQLQVDQENLKKRLNELLQPSE